MLLRADSLRSTCAGRASLGDRQDRPQTRLNVLAEAQLYLRPRVHSHHLERAEEPALRQSSSRHPVSYSRENLGRS